MAKEVVYIKDKTPRQAQIDADHQQAEEWAKKNQIHKASLGYAHNCYHTVISQLTDFEFPVKG